MDVFTVQLFFSCYFQASDSMDRDEEFAFVLQQQELALLHDSHFGRNVQVILSNFFFVSNIPYLGYLQTTKYAICYQRLAQLCDSVMHV